MNIMESYVWKSKHRIPSYHEDVTIEVDKLEYYCHRGLLACRSEYFRGLFSGHFCESRGRVVLNDIKSEVFEVVLQFLYTDHVTDFYDYEMVR